VTEKLEAIAEAGFKGVEILESDLLSFGWHPAEVGKGRLGYSGVTFQPFRKFQGMPESQRTKTFNRQIPNPRDVIAH
jgi:4-hydroxyphenylpyruvate dioxygenase